MLEISNVCIIIEAAVTYSQFLPATPLVAEWHTQKGICYHEVLVIFKSCALVVGYFEMSTFPVMLQCELYKIRYYSVKKPGLSRMAVDVFLGYYK